MKRPLIDSGPVSEFGEADASYVVGDRGVDFTEDMTYVPGFSDQRRQRDIELGEYGAGTRASGDVSKLDANVYWARRTSIGGTTDARKLMGAKNAGYRPVRSGDVGKPWLRELGVGWQVQPDGSIINPAGDGQLFVLEGQAAANRAASKTKKWLDQSGSVQMAPVPVAEQKGEPRGRAITMDDGSSIVDHAKAKGTSE